MRRGDRSFEQLLDARAHLRVHARLPLLDGDGAITIGIQRTGYSLLANAVCELDVQAEGGWSTTYIVDIAYADYAPVIFIENPNSIERDEKITANLACSVPFDIDDNPEDDTRSTYYKSEGLLTVSSNEIGWVVGVAALVLAVAWLVGAIQSPKPKAGKTPTAGRENSAPTVNENSTPASVAPEDDMQLQPVEEPEEVSEPFMEEDIVESTVEVIEAVEQTDTEPTNTTASGRLASLRDEIVTDDAPQREGTMEDRMKKFFGNE